MTPEERARLRELAEAVPMPGDDPELIGRWWDAGDLALYPIIHEADRQFVMATSPDVVRSLLDALDAAEASDREHLLRADLLRAQVAELEAERDRLAGRLERTTSIYHGVVEAATEAVDAIDPDADVEGTVACIWWVRKYALSMRAERDRLAAAVDRARALHTPVRYYTDPCDDPECEREHVELSVGDYYHGDVFELMCEVCSGGDLSECDYDDAVPHPCPTRRALDATPETGGES